CSIKGGGTDLVLQHVQHPGAFGVRNAAIRRVIGKARPSLVTSPDVVLLQGFPKSPFGCLSICISNDESLRIRGPAFAEEVASWPGRLGPSVGNLVAEEGAGRRCFNDQGPSVPVRRDRLVRHEWPAGTSRRARALLYDGPVPSGRRAESPR